MSKSRKHVLQWWMSPRKDAINQWWWGYRKVRICKVSEQDKKAYLDKMGVFDES